MAWATELHNTFRNNPFLRARVQTAALYFLYTAITLALVGGSVDWLTRDILLHTATHPGVDHSEAIVRIEQIRWVARVVYVVLFGVGAYFLVGVTLRAIRQMVELQKRFIANVAHELRTPLSVMRVETESALRHSSNMSKDELLLLLRNNLKNTKHISDVINFLVALSDVNADKKYHSLRDVSLQGVVTEAIKNIEFERQRKNITIRSELTPDEAVVQGNSVALEKMMGNLLQNAISYTPQDGEISVQVSVAADGPVIRVSDAGAGIATEDLPHIFEPFYRGRNRRVAGSGLGLALVQEIVKLHNATITVESTEGTGSSFSIRFST